MKVEKVKNEIIKKFNDLKIGEAFVLKDYFTNDICIKTYTFTCEDYIDLNGDYDEGEAYNALQLRTGLPFWCDEFMEVVVPNCKVVVE